MPISLEALRGYVLEELLARLIQNTGYRLIVDPLQDPVELESKGNGLVVRGRGGLHQVDVLGELAWIPAFTFPLRLIVEAKARSARTGIPAVRNAVGVLSDVNQNFSNRWSQGSAPVQRFSYRYALFSTSGFTRPAAEYALAHQISLVDLGAADFDDLVDLADDVARRVWGDLRGGGRAVRDFRARLRWELGTWPPGVEPPSGLLDDPRADDGLNLWAEVRWRVEALGELFVGMANGPYLLVLRARDPQAVVDAFTRDSLQHATITWHSAPDQRERWIVTLAAAPYLELAFALPAAVAEWIFDERGDARRRAWQFKRKFLSSITIYRHVDGRDRLYRIEFDPEQTAETVRRSRSQ